jgi:hypothetical protein
VEAAEGVAHGQLLLDGLFIPGAGARDSLVDRRRRDVGRLRCDVGLRIDALRSERIEVVFDAVVEPARDLNGLAARGHRIALTVEERDRERVCRVSGVKPAAGDVFAGMRAQSVVLLGLCSHPALWAFCCLDLGLVHRSLDRGCWVADDRMIGVLPVPGLRSSRCWQHLV